MFLDFDTQIEELVEQMEYLTIGHPPPPQYTYLPPREPPMVVVSDYDWGLPSNSDTDYVRAHPFSSSYYLLAPSNPAKSQYGRRRPYRSVRAPVF